MAYRDLVPFGARGGVQSTTDVKDQDGCCRAVADGGSLTGFRTLGIRRGLTIATYGPLREGGPTPTAVCPCDARTTAADVRVDGFSKYYCERAPNLENNNRRDWQQYDTIREN